MTRKHFEAIARALAISRPIPSGDALVDAAHAAQWRETRDAIASVLATYNSRFDRSRFYAATEVTR